jgi:dipicolinate synthase subunit A
MIGGDARQIEVIHVLAEMDATISLIGYDNLHNVYSGVTKQELSPAAFSGADAVILPPVGTDDDGYVETVFSAQRFQLADEHFEALPEHAKVYTGMAKPYLKKLCARTEIELVELFERDDVAIYNSIPTAEGALMLAIQNTDITIHNSNCIVLGMGRTGLTLARMLQALGAHVRMGVHRAEQFARAFEMRLSPFYTDDLAAQAGDADLIFNTIPHMIITAQVIARIPHRAVIIDLASKPGGTDFRFAEKRGIKAVLAPGLPGIVAPKTAGNIIARTLSQLILEDIGKRGKR